MLSSHGCCVRRYTIHHQYQYTIAKYTIRIGSTLPKYTLLESTWYLVSLVEAEPDTKWVDRGLITSRHRMLSSHGCCARTHTIHQQFIIAKSKYIPYLNVPRTCYLLWKRRPTRNGLTVADYISTTTNAIVARLLCACSRESIVWLSYAYDLGQAALGAGREAGRPCVLATMVIRTSMYGLRDSTASAAAVIGHHTQHAW